MRDDIEWGYHPVGTCQRTAQSQNLIEHNSDYNNTPPTRQCSSRFGSLTIQITYVSSLPEDLHSHTNGTGALHSSIQQSNTVFNRSRISRPLNSQEAQGISQILASRIVTFQQALPDTVRYLGAYRKPSSTEKGKQPKEEWTSHEWDDPVPLCVEALHIVILQLDS